MFALKPEGLTVDKLRAAKRILDTQKPPEGPIFIRTNRLCVESLLNRTLTDEEVERFEATDWCLTDADLRNG